MPERLDVESSNIYLPSRAGMLCPETVSRFPRSVVIPCVNCVGLWRWSVAWVLTCVRSSRHSEIDERTDCADRLWTEDLLRDVPRTMQAHCIAGLPDGGA